jgi:hypothetical protein
MVPAAAPPPMTSTAAADGTSQRIAGLDLNTDTVSTSCVVEAIVRRVACDEPEKRQLGTGGCGDSLRRP